MSNLHPNLQVNSYQRSLWFLDCWAVVNQTHKGLYCTWGAILTRQLYVFGSN